MAAETATVLVTDLAGSTDLRVALGEQRAEEIRRLHDAALVDVARRGGGTVVKGLGDGVLVRFPGAAEAVTAAVAMQQGIESLGRREQVELRIRVGVSSGDVTHEDGDPRRAESIGITFGRMDKLAAALSAAVIFATAGFYNVGLKVPVLSGVLERRLNARLARLLDMYGHADFVTDSECYRIDAA
jgi:class 3 adenylate cyclase